MVKHFDHVTDGQARRPPLAGLSSPTLKCQPKRGGQPTGRVNSNLRLAIWAAPISPSAGARAALRLPNPA